MKIAFVTQQIPYGEGEGFIIDELEEFSQQNYDITIFPVRPQKRIYHRSAERLRMQTVAVPLLSIPMAIGFLKFTALRTKEFIVVMRMVIQSRNLRILIKNIAVLPKAVYIAKQVKLREIEHIHAYWASTSATVAMVASALSSVPWSLTCFRWDVSENNLLALKYLWAEFIRCPDEQSKREIADICGIGCMDKLYLIRSGLRMPRRSEETTFGGCPPRSRPFCFAVPAMFVEKKGHIYLLEAIRILASKGCRFSCWLLGDGPLRGRIKRRIRELQLDKIIEMKGMLPLEEMHLLYTKKLVDLIVLPSIVTKDNQKEGIPASLIDALAHGIPIISTRSGGIPELVTTEVGLLVDPCNAAELASSMEYLMTHPERMQEMSASARSHVSDSYDVCEVVRRMGSLIKKAHE